MPYKFVLSALGRPIRRLGILTRHLDPGRLIGHTQNDKNKLMGIASYP